MTSEEIPVGNIEQPVAANNETSLESLQAKVAQLIDEVSRVSNKNAELLQEKRNLKESMLSQNSNDVSTKFLREEYTAEIEAHKTQTIEAQQQSELYFNQLQASLKDNALETALRDQHVNPALLGGALAVLGPRVTLEDKGGTLVALFDKETPVTEFIQQWVQTETGRQYVGIKSAGAGIPLTTADSATLSVSKFALRS